MKNFYYFLFFLLVTNLYTKDKVDSLFKIYENTNNDSIKIDVMSKIFENHFHSDFHRTFNSIFDILEIAQKSNKPIVKANAYFLIIGFFHETNNDSISNYYLKYLEPLVKEANDTILTIRLLRVHSVLMSKAGDLTSSLNKLFEAKKLAEKVKSKHLTIINRDIGLIYLNKGNIKESFKYLNKITDKFKDNYDYKSLIYYYFRVTQLYFYSINDWDTGKKYLDSAFIYSNQFQINNYLPNLYIYLSDYYQTKGDYKKSVEMLEKRIIFLRDNNTENFFKDFYFKTIAQKFNEKLELLNRTNEINKKLEANNHKLTIYITILVVLVIVVILILIYNLRLTKKLNDQKNILEQQNVEINLTNSNLEKTSIKLTESIEEKNKLFSIISIDLKDSINNFLLVTNILNNSLETMDNSLIKQYIEILDNNSKSTANLLTNLLLWSNSVTGKIPYNPSKFDVKSFILDKCNEHNLIAQSKKIKINLITSISCEIVIDVNFLNIIIKNLLGNAIKYSKVGGIIEVGIYDNAFDITLMIRDYGVGMTDDTLKNLFKIKDKKSQLGTSGELGTGMGLIIVKSLVEKCNGNIEIKSFRGEGTTVILSFQKQSISLLDT